MTNSSITAVNRDLPLQIPLFQQAEKTGTKLPSETKKEEAKKELPPPAKSKSKIGGNRRLLHRPDASSTVPPESIFD